MEINMHIISYPGHANSKNAERHHMLPGFWTELLTAGCWPMLTISDHNRVQPTLARQRPRPAAKKTIARKIFEDLPSDAISTAAEFQTQVPMRFRRHDWPVWLFAFQVTWSRDEPTKALASSVRLCPSFSLVVHRFYFWEHQWKAFGPKAVAKLFFPIGDLSLWANNMYIFLSWPILNINYFWETKGARHLPWQYTTKRMQRVYRNYSARA